LKSFIAEGETMADDFRRELDREGPGGIKCECCRLGGYSHGKERARANKLVRKRLKVKAQDIINEAHAEAGAGE